MPKKAPPDLSIARMQIVVGEVVTDPAELAAFDEMRKHSSERNPRNRGISRTMQIVVGEVVTDPAELAACDRMRKRLKQKKQRSRAKRKGTTKKKR